MARGGVGLVPVGPLGPRDRQHFVEPLVEHLVERLVGTRPPALRQCARRGLLPGGRPADRRLLDFIRGTFSASWSSEHEVARKE